MERFKYTDKGIYIFFLIIYILCLPLNAINIGPLGSALKIIAVLPIGITIISGADYAISKPLKFQLAFVVFAFLSMNWTCSLDASMDRNISYILLFVLLLSGSAFKYSTNDVKKVKCALAWSSRMTAIVMLIFAEYVNGRFRLMGIIKEDPNYLCAYFSFGVIYALSIITGKNKTAKKIIAVGELALYFYLILISGSRGGLLAIASGVLVYLLTYGNKKQTHIVNKLILITMITFLLLIMFDYLPENLRLRFTVNNVVKDGGSGRTKLWQQALDLFFNANPCKKIFGFGTASIRWCFTKYGYSDVNVVHNMFIETLAELGIIGLIIYIAAIFSFIKAAFKFNDKFSFAVIFSMFVMSLSTSIYTFKPYFNIMLYIVIMQNMQIKKEKS